MKLLIYDLASHYTDEGTALYPSRTDKTQTHGNQLGTPRIYAGRPRRGELPKLHSTLNVSRQAIAIFTMQHCFKTLNLAGTFAEGGSLLAFPRLKGNNMCK